MQCTTPEPNPPKTGDSTGYDKTGNCRQAQKNARQRALADALKWALGYAPECPDECKIRTVKITFKFQKDPCKEDPRDKNKLECVCTWTATVECTPKDVAAPAGKTASGTAYLGLDCTQYFEDKGTGKGEDPIREGEAKKAAETDAREQAEKAALAVSIDCMSTGATKCPTSQITVSIGKPVGKLHEREGDEQHSKWTATCDWKLVAECV